MIFQIRFVTDSCRFPVFAPKKKGMTGVVEAKTSGVTQQLTEIIIPSYAAWFKFGVINPIEEKVITINPNPNPNHQP